jgi:hypothetical protein
MSVIPDMNGPPGEHAVAVGQCVDFALRVIFPALGPYAVKIDD